MDHPAEPGDEAVAPSADAAQKGRLISAESLAHVGALAAQGERITGASLARALGVSQVTGSARLRALEQVGHVRRTGTGAGTCYELVTDATSATAAPEPSPMLPSLVVTPVLRPSPDSLPVGRATLPEDVLRDRRRDPEPAPTDIDTVIDWLAANGDRVAAAANGGWWLNGTPGRSERDLIKRANGKRAELGLPAFSLGRG